LFVPAPLRGKTELERDQFSMRNLRIKVCTIHTGTGTIPALLDSKPIGIPNYPYVK
jgi:hypothetical protein